MRPGNCTATVCGALLKKATARGTRLHWALRWSSNYRALSLPRAALFLANSGWNAVIVAQRKV